MDPSCLASKVQSAAGGALGSLIPNECCFYHVHLFITTVHPSSDSDLRSTHPGFLNMTVSYLKALYSHVTSMQ